MVEPTRNIDLLICLRCPQGHVKRTPKDCNSTFKTSEITWQTQKKRAIRSSWLVIAHVSRAASTSNSRKAFKVEHEAGRLFLDNYSADHPGVGFTVVRVVARRHEGKCPVLAGLNTIRIEQSAYKTRNRMNLTISVDPCHRIVQTHQDSNALWIEAVLGGGIKRTL